MPFHDDVIYRVSVEANTDSVAGLNKLRDAVRGVSTEIDSMGKSASTHLTRIGRESGSLGSAIQSVGSGGGPRVSGVSSSTVAVASSRAGSASVSSGRLNEGGSRVGAPSGAAQVQGLQSLTREMGSASQATAKFQSAQQSLVTSTVSSTAAISANKREFASNVEKFASGIGQMASGVAFLTAGNEDVKAFVDGLLKIKGTADVFIGLTKTVSGAYQSFSLLTERQKLNAASNTQVGASATSAALKEREQAVALQAVAVAANQAAVATRNLDTAQDALATNPVDSGGGGGFVGRGPRGRNRRGILNFGGGVGGAIGGVVAGDLIANATGSGYGGLVGQLGVDALLSGGLRGGGLRGLGRGALSVGRSALGFGGRAALAAAPAAGLIGAGAAGGLALVEGVQAIRGQEGFVSSAFGAYRARQSRIQSDKDLARYGEFSSGFQATNRFEDQLRTGRSASAFDRSISSIDSASRIGSARANTTQDQIGVVSQEQVALSRELAKQMETVRGYTDGISTSSEEYHAALDRSAKVSDQLVSSQERQLSLVRQESDERRRGADERIQNAQRELQLQQGIGKTSQEQLLSAKERFAGLSTLEQGDALRAGQIAKRDPSALSDQQAQLIDRVGDESSRTAVRKRAVGIADRAGFNTVFGSAERDAISQAHQAAQKAQIEIKDQTTFKLDTTSRETKLIESISNKIEKTMAESNQRVIAGVEARMAATEQKLRDEFIAKNRTEQLGRRNATPTR